MSETKKCRATNIKFFLIALVVSWMPILHASYSGIGFWGNTNVRLFITPFMVLHFLILVALMRVGARLTRFFLVGAFVLLALYFLSFPILKCAILTLICGY